MRPVDAFRPASELRRNLTQLIPDPSLAVVCQERCRGDSLKTCNAMET